MKVLLVLSVVSVVVSSQVIQEWKPVSPNPTERTVLLPIPAEMKERTGKFISFKKLYTNQVESNEIDHETKDNDGGDPDDVLTSIYSDCVLQFSFPCLQKKFLVFLDRLGRMDGFQIFGDYLTMHKVRNETTKPITEKEIEARMLYKSSTQDLDSLVHYSIDRFFNNHVMRVKLPFGLTLGGETGRSAPSDMVEIGFERGMSEGRGKKKKLLMMFLMMLKMKKAAALAAFLVLLKIKVIKALILAKIALILAKIGLLKKFLMKKHHEEEKKIVIIHDPHHSHESYHHDSSDRGDSYSPSYNNKGYSNSGSGHGGWARKYDAQSLAYRGHNKTSDKS